MKLLFDTSVLIASLVERHSAHTVAYPWLESVIRGNETGLLCAHSLAEAYAKLTRIPFEGGVLSVSQAKSLILDTIARSFTVVSLTTEDYESVIEHLAENDLTGGVIYDALILRAGVKAGADRILTLNPRHFRRIDPALTDRIVDPATLAQ